MAAFEKISRLHIETVDAGSVIDVRKALLPATAHSRIDYDPRDYRQPPSEIQPWIGYFNVVRTLCGPGLLGMPVVLSASGLLAGSMFVLVVAVVIIHTHHLLLDSLTEISRQLNIPYISYRYGFRIALLSGPPIFHCIGERGPTIIATFMIMSQLGICTVFVILTSDSLRDIVDCQSVVPGLLALLPCYLLLEYFMKNLTRVSYVVLLGTVLNTAGLILIFYHIFKEPVKDVVWIQEHAWGWLFSTGMCMFNFSAVGVVLSIDKNLKHPRIMTSRCGLLNVGLGISTGLSLLIGTLGYWAFGAMEENVLRSLPYEDTSAMVAIGLYLISVALTYPLQCYPAISVIIEIIRYAELKSKPSNYTLKIIEKIARPIFVILSFTIAYYVPFQGPFVAFVGSLCTCMIAIVFPVMMDMSLRYSAPGSYGAFYYHLIKDLILMAMGLLAWSFGVYFCGYLIYIRILSSYSPNAEEYL